MRQAHLGEYLSLYRHWNFTRTAIAVDSLQPFALWNEAMWRNLVRRIELECGWIFERRGGNPVRALPEAPMIEGAIKTFAFAAGGERGTVAAFSPEGDCPHLVFASASGRILRVDWTIPLNQEADAARVLSILTGEEGAFRKQLLESEGLWYWDAGSGSLCRATPLARPGGGWAWRIEWKNPEVPSGLFLIMTTDGEVLDESFVPQEDQPGLELLGLDSVW
jgi:hypothetical protein